MHDKICHQPATMLQLQRITSTTWHDAGFFHLGYAGQLHAEPAGMSSLYLDAERVANAAQIFQMGAVQLASALPTPEEVA